MRRQKPEAALHEAEKLLAREPNNPNYLTLKGSILVRIGDQKEALKIYQKVLTHYPNQARAQMSYGHTLKTVGRLDESIEAYRKCIRLSPEVGEAYWSLANLKTFRFSDEDIGNMREQVTAQGGDADDQSHLAFVQIKPNQAAPRHVDVREGTETCDHILVSEVAEQIVAGCLRQRTGHRPEHLALLNGWPHGAAHASRVSRADARIKPCENRDRVGTGGRQGARNGQRGVDLVAGSWATLHA